MKLRKNQFLGIRQRIELKYVIATACFTLFAGVFIFLAGNFGINTTSKGAPGKDGAKSILSGTVILNEFTTLTSNASIGATTISVAASSLNANNRFSSGLSAGDLIMIIQMQGATITTSNNSTYGTISAYNNCGNYEFADVSLVPNSTSITLTTGLKNAYTHLGKVQIVRVPRYTTLSLSSGATISTDDWAGSTGGIIAMEVSGTSTINGTIDASSKGFLGGATDQISLTGITSYRSSFNWDGAEKGESIAGPSSSLANGRYGRGAPANGGGGGNPHNAGGGGGANGGNTASWTGMGNPQNTFSNWTTAWNIESASFATSTSSGGGRGGYGWSLSSQNPLTLAPGNSSWNGDNRPNVGGLGGRPLDYSSGRIFFGGGGGAGDSNNNNGTAGGDGGGIIFLLSGGNITGTGTINSNGASVPTMGTSGNGDAAGGGGGGGTVIIYNKNSSVNNLTINANGGQGGNHAISAGNFPEVEGPGGSGGGGYVALSSSNNVTINANGGTNGTTNSTVFTNFTPNGATKGGSGTSNGTAPSNPYSGTSTLPVVLTSFNAKANGKSVELTWTTASEKENNFFTIERSIDGINFSKIGQVKGNGTTTEIHNYNLTDINTLNGVSYYRLKQTDYNGKTETYNPVTVNTNQRNEGLQIKTISPNPFKNECNIYFTSDAPTKTRVAVYSNTGQVIKSEVIATTVGNNLYIFRAPENMSPGSYVLSISREGEMPITKKIIKN